jgi:hypothetical protein
MSEGGNDQGVGGSQRMRRAIYYPLFISHCSLERVR